FSFADLAPGNYRLVVHGLAGEVVATQSVALPAGEKVTRIVRAVQSGSISGRVVDENREAVKGLQVELVTTVYESGALKYVPRSTAEVNTQGEYRVVGLRPGVA